MSPTSKASLVISCTDERFVRECPQQCHAGVGGVCQSGSDRGAADSACPVQPFIGLLNSPVWTDRNKASFALAELSERRDPKLLGKLQREALAALIEMAHWKSGGHAKPALMILGRIGGQSDDAIQAAWTRGEREGIINAAVKRQ